IAAAALRAGPQRARVASAVRNETPEKPGTGGRPGSSVAASARRMARVLVLFAHPALEKSRVGRRLLDAIQSVPSVQIHDLYEEYPEFDIDVEREQELLRSHDVIVLMHPLYWYSTPALLKQWFDLVLEHGFAYGEAAGPSRASGCCVRSRPAAPTLPTNLAGTMTSRSESSWHPS